MPCSTYGIRDCGALPSISIFAALPIMSEGFWEDFLTSFLLAQQVETSQNLSSFERHADIEAASNLGILFDPICLSKPFKPRQIIF